MKLQPLGERVVVKPKETEEKTKGGLYIPDNAKEKQVEGTVESVGSQVEYDVKENDTVLYSKYSGNEFEFNGGKYLILKQEDILAKVEK